MTSGVVDLANGRMDRHGRSHGGKTWEGGICSVCALKTKRRDETRMRSKSLLLQLRKHEGPMGTETGVILHNNVKPKANGSD